MWRTGAKFHSRPYKKGASCWTDFHNIHLLHSTVCRAIPISVQMGRILEGVFLNFNLCLSEKYVFHYTYFHKIDDYLTALSGDIFYQISPKFIKTHGR
jgi:hypothetical protein